MTKGEQGSGTQATTQATVTQGGFTFERVQGYMGTVVEGADLGLRFELTSTATPTLLVGSGPSCDVRLNDSHVSRRHLSFELSGARLREAFLTGKERVRLGATTLLIEPTREPQARLISTATSFGDVVGASPAMRQLYPRCERLAQADVPVVIEGETGTGKEALAEAMHLRGPRAAGPYVVFDCTAVAPSLIESALFGHEKGAFTGAVAAAQGVFERAHGGTLLIDEIGDLPLDQQSKLLRAIERSQVTRVGGQRQLTVDVRLLVATRRDLDAEVAAGRFRDDLFHRIAVTRIELPPLRERRGDVRLLAEHFVRQRGADPAHLPPDLLRSWEAQPWPGNVRELRNTVLRRLALGDLDEPVGAVDAPPAPRGDDLVEQILGLELPLAEARQRVIDEFERRYVERMLQRHQGSVGRAAAAAGVVLRHFRRLKSRLVGEREGDGD